MVISEPGRHGSWAVHLTLAGKDIVPLVEAWPCWGSPECLGLPRAQPTVALCDPEQVTCMLSLRSLVSKMGTELG